MKVEGPSQGGIPADRVGQGKEVVHVEPCVPLVLLPALRDEAGPVADRPDGASREQAEGRRPARHPREVANDCPLDSLSPLAIRVAQPDFQRFVQVRGRDEQRVADQRESNERAEPLA